MLYIDFGATLGHVHVQISKVVSVAEYTLYLHILAFIWTAVNIIDNPARRHSLVRPTAVRFGLVRVFPLDSLVVGMLRFLPGVYGRFHLFPIA